MRWIALVIFCIGCLVSLEAAPLKDRLNVIQTEIERTIREADSTAQVGIEAVSLKKGLSFYRKNEDRRFIPASSIKLFIAAAALDALGADYRFETQIRGKQRGAVVEGCTVVASGDPSLSVKDLEDLVLQLKRKGVERIEGDLVLDLGVFDDVVKGPGWMWDEEPAYWCSPMGPLNIEHNCVEVWVKPAPSAAHFGSVSVEPRNHYVQIENRSETVKDGESLEVARRPLSKGTVIDVSGKIEVGSESRRFVVPVKEPHFLAADLLIRLLKENQIWVSGSVRLDKVESRAEKLASHESAPLGELIKTALKQSDNMYADCLFKKIGEVKCGAPGTWVKGSQSVREFLTRRVGLDCEEMVILDGCGLSRYNLVSPHQMVMFLSWVHREFPYASELKAALSIGGVDGTLKSRMQQIQAKVRAKSGTMSGVSALCGFLVTEDHEEMAFAIFVNNYVKRGREIKRELEDKVCQVLAAEGF